MNPQRTDGPSIIDRLVNLVDRLLGREPRRRSGLAYAPVVVHNRREPSMRPPATRR